MNKEERLAYMRRRYPQLKLQHKLAEEEMWKIPEPLSANEPSKELEAFGEYQKEVNPNALLSEDK